jgi:hypothetical protein
MKSLILSAMLAVTALAGAVPSFVAPANAFREPILWCSDGSGGWYMC